MPTSFYWSAESRAAAAADGGVAATSVGGQHVAHERDVADNSGELVAVAAPDPAAGAAADDDGRPSKRVRFSESVETREYRREYEP